MPPGQPIRLSQTDLKAPSVENYLQEQAALRRAAPETTAQPLVVRIIYSSYFYLSLAGGLGALAAWAIAEPFINERVRADPEASGGSILALILTFPAVSGFIGLFLGAAEGLMSRNFMRALICAVVGLGIGFLGGLVMLIPTGIIFAIMSTIARRVGPPKLGGVGLPTGMGFLLLMMGRGAAWALSASVAGIGQGIALREKKVILNGLVGGVLGGLLGGVLFDPIYLLLQKPDSAWASRAVGFCFIGIMVGLFVGLVEQWTKTAWVLMRVGPLAGKQFVIYRSPTVIGSAPKADIYVFKDPAIGPRHALIHNRGGRFEMEDCNTPDGTYVNGVAIRKQVLKSGDQIVIGKTVFEFQLRESK